MTHMRDDPAWFRSGGEGGPHHNTGDQFWKKLCRRTNDPKLAWLEARLASAGIESRRNGMSFHAPILEVRAHQLDDAWAILAPVDDIPDDAPQFLREGP